MQLFKGECSVEYRGRGNTTLAPAVRLIMLKSDGSIAIHNDKGFKPLNYMNAPTTLSFDSDGKTLIVDGKKERLTIKFTDEPEEIRFDDIVVDDPGLVRAGTETELQEWISNNLYIISDAHEELNDGVIRLESREFETGDGPIDIFARDEIYFYAIEVKRNASTPAVHQLKRYVSALAKDYPEERIVPLLIAESFNPTSLKKMDELGYRSVVVPENWQKLKKVEQVENLFNI